MNSKIILKTIATEGLFCTAMGVCGTLDIARISLVAIGKGAAIVKRVAEETEELSNTGANNVTDMKLKVYNYAVKIIDKIQESGDDAKMTKKKSVMMQYVSI